MSSVNEISKMPTIKELHFIKSAINFNLTTLRLITGLNNCLVMVPTPKGHIMCKIIWT